MKIGTVDDILAISTLIMREPFLRKRETMKITKPSAIAAVDLPCPVCGELCENSDGSQMITSTDTKVTCPRCRVVHRVDVDVFMTTDDKLEEIAALARSALEELPKGPLVKATEHKYLLGVSAAEYVLREIINHCKKGEGHA